MAVEKMKIVSIIGKYNMLDGAIEAFLNSGCYQPEQTASLTANINGFSHITDENPYANRLQKITEILTGSGVDLVTVKNNRILTDDEIDQKLGVLEERLGALKRQENLLEVDITNVSTSISLLQHFLTLRVDLHHVFTSKFTKVRFGRLPIDSYIKLKSYEDNPYVLFFPCEEDKTHLWGMYVVPIDKHDEIDNIFADLYFERLRIPETAGTPLEGVEAFEKQLDELTINHKELDRIINDFLSLQTDDYLELYTQLKHSYEAFEIRRFGSKYGDSFILLGWIPELQIPTFTKYLDTVDGIEFKIEEAKAVNFSPPTRLKNAKAFKPFEFYVNMFGAPGYNEVDPTFFMAIVYILIYGIMFADVGQGLVLSLAGFLMYKYKQMAVGRILIPCGISGAFFGLVFGSVFGFEEVLNPFYKLLGFHEKPIIITDEILPTLLSAILIGVALLIVALCINIYSCLKRKDLEHGIFGENGICGLLVYVSIVLSALSMAIPSLKPFSLPILIIGIIIPLILMFFKEPLGKLAERDPDWKPHNWSEYIMQSVFEIYDAFISYIANTFSFLRIGAFILIHISMMSVFFKIAELVGGGIGGIIVIVFGNIFVLGLEGLLVSIQSLRLMFYEIFNRFYSGDGHAFEPAEYSVDINKN